MLGDLFRVLPRRGAVFTMAAAMALSAALSGPALALGGLTEIRFTGGTGANAPTVLPNSNGCTILSAINSNSTAAAANSLGAGAPSVPALSARLTIDDPNTTDIYHAVYPPLRVPVVTHLGTSQAGVASGFATACGLTNVTVTQYSPAPAVYSSSTQTDPDFSNATYFGIKFTANYNNVPYNYEVAYSGQTSTQLIVTSTSAAVPVLGLTAVPSVTATTVGRPFSYALTPTVSSENGVGVVSLETTLPSGLFYGSASGANWLCSSTPVSNQDKVTCTYSAAVLAGSRTLPLTLNVTSAGASSGYQPVFTFKVNGAPDVTATPTAVTVNGLPNMFYPSPTTSATSNVFTRGLAVTNFAPLQSIGGTAPYTWTISPALPAGLSMNTSTGVISGTPTATSAETTYTVGLTDFVGAVPSIPTRTFLLTINPPAPVVTGVSPSSGGTGGGTVVTITGSNFTSASAVSFGAAAAAGFTVNSDTSITATSPSAATAGAINVRVTTAGGTSAVGAGNAFTYRAPPTISDLLPNSGPEAGGTLVSLIGTGFDASSEVRVGNTVVSASFVNSTLMTFTMPAGTGRASIIVTTGGVPSAGSDFTYVPPPTISSITPNIGFLAGGEQISIKGQNLIDVTAIKFGTLDATTFVRLSDQEWLVLAPASQSLGKVDVSVVTPFGTSANTAADDYTYGAVPTVTSFTHNATVPYNSGSGTAVTINAAAQANPTGLPTSWSVSSSSTKGANVNVNASGLVSYTPPVGARGSDTFTIQALNGLGTSQPATVTVNLGDPVFSASAPGANGVFNTAVNPFAVTLTGGKEPYTNFSATGLPDGLSITSTGTIQGTPTATGTFNAVRVTATDSSNTPFTGSATLTLVIGKGNQTINYIDPADRANYEPNMPVSQIADATSGLTVNFLSATPLVCSVTGRVATVLGAGTCTITATQAGNSNWNPAPQVQQSFTIGKGNQTVNFTDPADVANFVRNATVSLTGTATSGLTVAFTSATTSVCSVSGTRATLLSAGTCTVNADQAGDANWNPAVRVQQSFTIGKGVQTVSFTDPADVTNFVPNATVSLVATATSGLTVAFTSATTSVCSVSGTTATLLSAGTCSITANQAGDANWNAATQAQQSFSIGKGAQSITFNNPADVANFVPNATVPMSATATSGLTVAFASATPLVCSVSGTTATLLAAGTCAVNMSQAGDANWNAAPQAQQSFSIGKGVQTITFTDPADVTNFVPDATVSLAGTATSGLTVAFASATPLVCSVSGSTATLLAAGTCTVNADQAGNANWSAAAQAQQSFTIGKGVQTVSFTDPADVANFVPNATVSLTGTATSGLTVAFASATPLVCSVSGTTATLLAAGTCTVNADQAGDANWNAAAQVPQSFTIGKGMQTVSFTDPADVANFVPNATVPLVATATSRLTVAFASATPEVCLVNGTTATLVAAGSCTVVAAQAGDANWNAAPLAMQSFTIGKGAQTITFGLPANQTFAPDATVSLNASASSGLAVAFTSATPAVCSVSGSTATLLGAGTCTVNADQAGNADWNAATQVQRSFSVGKGAQTVTFGLPANQTFAPNAPVLLNASASSGLAVAFTSATPAVCSVSGTTATLLGAGTCTLNADQAGNADWNAAAQVQRSFSVDKGAQTVDFTGPVNVEAFVPNATVSLSATATSGLTVAFTSATTSVCSVSGTTATLLGAGTCTVNADQAGNADWNAAAQVQRSFEIGKGVQVITFTKPADTNGFTLDQEVQLAATGGASGNAVTFETTSPACVISGTKAIVKAVGTCSVTAKQAGNVNWLAAVAVTQSFEIGKSAQSIDFEDPGPQVFGTTLTVSATATSGLTVGFTSVTPAACSVTAGGEVSFLTVGECIIAADQPGNAEWQPAPQVTRNLSVTGEKPAVQKELIEDVQRARAQALVLVQPDLSVLLTDPEGAPTGGLTVSSMGGEADLFRWNGPVWFRLAGSRTVHDDGARDHYAQLSFGSHLKLGPNALLGLMGTFDTMRMTESAGLAEGTGWLVGPYLVARLGQSPIYLDARALTGRTMDEITETGRPASQVEGSRSLIMVKLSGKHVTGGLTLSPNLSYAMVSQESDEYRTSSGILIPGVTSDFAQGAVGLDFAYATVNALGAASYTGGIGLVFAEDSVNGSSEGVSYRLGIAQKLGEGVDLNVDVTGQSASGGASRSLGLSATLQAKF